jgi:hypothetical protein
MIDGCVVKCGSTNKHQKDMCLKKIQLHAQNVLINLGSITRTIWGDVYDHLTSMRILMSLNNEQDIHMGSNHEEKCGSGTRLLNNEHLTRI